MVRAMSEVVLERGAASVNVANVVKRSGVSRRTFYEVFDDREDCLLATLEDALQRIEKVVLPVYYDKGSQKARGTRRAHGWRERIRAALIELLGLFDEDPALARLVVVESLAAGPVALERRSELLAMVIAAIDEGRLEAGAGSEPPPLSAEGVVGAVCSILYARLSTPFTSDRLTGKVERERLIALTGPLMGMIVLPYLGRAAANRELERPVPVAHTIPERGGAGYTFRDLGMRLTYRTIRVLDAIATSPGASNRLLGETAGIQDQGQISKLLSRLQGLGLIENTIAEAGQGTPNAWRLTDKGRNAHEAIRAPLTSTRR
jgi:AcrR family transcriptional regulator